MTWKDTSQPTRLRRIASGILIVGFASALVIYLAAAPPAENPLGYDPNDTKQYLRQLEMYGGTSNVIASEFREWVTSMFHGKRLAGTVAGTAAIVAGFMFYVARRLPFMAAEDVRGNDASGPA